MKTFKRLKVESVKNYKSKLLLIPWGICWLISLILLSVFICRIVWHDGCWVLLLANMFTLYLFLPLYPIAVLALIKRRLRLAGVAGVLIFWHLSWVIPPFVPHAGDCLENIGERLVLVSANLLMVHPSPDTLADELEDLNSDVLLLQEYSPIWEAAFLRRGFFKKYPYNHAVVREDSFGGAIFSKYPLVDVQVIAIAELPQIQATVLKGDKSFRLLNIHTLPPRIAEYVDGHHLGLEQIRDSIQNLSNEDSSFIVAGDFNSTQFSAFYKQASLYAHDAWDKAGFGFGNTAPNGMFPIPPIRLDHIFLSKNICVETVALGKGVGSDHKPIRAVVKLLEK